MNSPLKLGTSILIASGFLGFVGSAPANAAACPTGSPGLGTLLATPPGTFSCDQGGFTFTLTNWSGFTALDGISFSNPIANQFTFNVNSNVTWTGTTPRTLGYTVTARSGKVLEMFTAALSSSVPNPKEGKWTVAGTQGSAVGTKTNGSANDGEFTYTSNLASDTFTASLGNVTGGGIQAVQSTYTDMDSTTAVPGPLPILGAGAAFGFTRKLRRRIKLAA